MHILRAECSAMLRQAYLLSEERGHTPRRGRGGHSSVVPQPKRSYRDWLDRRPEIKSVMKRVTLASWLD